MCVWCTLERGIRWRFPCAFPHKLVVLDPLQRAQLHGRRGRELTEVNSSHAGCKKRWVLALAVMGLAADDQVRWLLIPSLQSPGNALLPVSHELLGLLGSS